MSKRFKIVGINFDHFHMGDLLRYAAAHPEAEIAGICDEQSARMEETVRNFSIPRERVFTDYRACLEKTQPDVAILCPSAATHGEWTRRVAEYGVHVLMEKPFAASLAEADAMAAAVAKSGKVLAINWPLRWDPTVATVRRLLDEGTIGTVTHVHYLGGNRGPLCHAADKQGRVPTAEDKAASWFYRAELGGGSLIDYAGYGTTFGTWYMDGRKPVDVMAMTASEPGLEVDEQSVIVARYETGLSKFETHWGTFTDPWTHQPQPKCGFVLCGTEGTLASYGYEKSVRLQTRQAPEGYELPVDLLAPPHTNPIEYFLHCLETGEAVTGPLSVRIARIGQQIVDTALLSAREGRVMPLLK